MTTAADPPCDPSDDFEAVPEVDLDEARGAPKDHIEYKFDPRHVAPATEVIDATYRSGASSRVPVDPSFACDAAGVEIGQPLRDQLVYIASYSLRGRMRNQKPGCDLTPLDDKGPLTWPPAIRGVPLDTVELWRSLGQAVTEPGAIARMEDLLFSNGEGDVRAHALRASSAYLAASRQVEVDDLVDGNAVSLVLRGWTLATMMRDESLEDDLRDRMVELVTVEMEAGSQRLGIINPLLCALADERRARRGTDPIDVDELLWRALGHLTSGQGASEIADLLRERHTDPEERERIARAEVAVHRAEADSRPGAARQMLLAATARLAGRRQLHDVEADVIREMQATAESEVKLATIRVPITLPRHAAEDYLRPFTESTRWTDALRYFLNTAPPTGKVDWLAKQASDSVRGSPLASMVGTVILGRGRLPRADLSSPDEKLAHAKAQSADMVARLQGRLLGEGLNRMPARYGVPSEQELTLFFAGIELRSEGSHLVLANALARALGLYWAEEYDACVHVIVPRIEAAARLLLLELDAAVYRLERGDTPGGYVGLGVLLNHLDDFGLDPSWSYFMRWLLLGPLGGNLRNDLAHGLTEKIESFVVAALALRAAAILLPIVPASAAESAGEKTGPIVDRPQLLALLRKPVPGMEGIELLHPGPLESLGRVMDKTVAFGLDLVRRGRTPKRGSRS